MDDVIICDGHRDANITAHSTRAVDFHYINYCEELGTPMALLARLDRHRGKDGKCRRDRTGKFLGPLAVNLIRKVPKVTSGFPGSPHHYCNSTSSLLIFPSVDFNRLVA